MSSDFAIKPVATSAPAPVVRPTPEAARQAVVTELAAAQSVTAADSVQTARNDALASRDRLSRQAVFDRDAAEMVFKVVDRKTDDVVGQVPEEAQLRRRAYFRELSRTATTLRRQHTDLTV